MAAVGTTKATIDIQSEHQTPARRCPPLWWSSPQPQTTARAAPSLSSNHKRQFRHGANQPETHQHDAAITPLMENTISSRVLLVLGATHFGIVQH